MLIAFSQKLKNGLLSEAKEIVSVVVPQCL